MAGTLFVVATPIGNLDDLSPRALRVLREVAIIAAEDTRRTAHLVQRFGLTTRTTSLHEHNEHTKADDLISRLLAGEDIALVSDAGTPTVSDPGQHLVSLAHGAGVRVEPVPGPSAIIAALSASGLASDSFLFLGFPPTKSADRAAWFARARSAAALAPTMVFYEAPHRIRATLTDLHRELGDVNILLARELTKAHEEVRFAPVSMFLTLEEGRGEYTVVCDLGHITYNEDLASELTPQQLSDEFGVLTKTDGLTRRQAISALSRKYRISARDVYARLERAKDSIG